MTNVKTACFLMELVTAIVVSMAVDAGARDDKPPVPDFTQGGKTDGSHDWTLGSTGARGWIHAWKHTADARQILITEVAEGSPADGVLEVNDVILGVAGKPFSDDARIQFARAVMQAEQEDSRGILPLIRCARAKPRMSRLRFP